MLVRNPSPDVCEGDGLGVAIVIEFESFEVAKSFYDSNEYIAARAVRQAAAETDLILVEGR